MIKGCHQHQQCPHLGERRISSCFTVIVLHASVRTLRPCLFFRDCQYQHRQRAKVGCTGRFPRLVIVVYTRLWQKQKLWLEGIFDQTWIQALHSVLASLTCHAGMNSSRDMPCLTKASICATVLPHSSMCSPICSLCTVPLVPILLQAIIRNEAS